MSPWKLGRLGDVRDLPHLALVSSTFVYILAPETKGRPLEAIRTYRYNGGRWPDKTRT